MISRQENTLFTPKKQQNLSNTFTWYLDKYSNYNIRPGKWIGPGKLNCCIGIIYMATCSRFSDIRLAQTSHTIIYLGPYLIISGSCLRFSVSTNKFLVLILLVQIVSYKLLQNRNMHWNAALTEKQEKIFSFWAAGHICSVNYLQI